MKRSFAIAAFALSFLALISCGGGGSGGSGGSPDSGPVTLLLPFPLSDQNSNCAALSVEVLANGSTSAGSVSVDCQAGTVTAEFPDLTFETHSFTAAYSAGGVVVATGSGTFLFDTQTASPVDLTDAGVHFPDDDGDGYTNLAELELGTDPVNAADRPDTVQPRYSASYVIWDELGKSFTAATSQSALVREGLATQPAASSAGFSVRAGL